MVPKFESQIWFLNTMIVSPHKPTSNENSIGSIVIKNGQMSKHLGAKIRAKLWKPLHYSITTLTINANILHSYKYQYQQPSILLLTEWHWTYTKEEKKREREREREKI